MLTRPNALLSLVAAVLLWVYPAQAQDNELYVVRDVPVDVTASNAAMARDQALLQGQREALRRLFGRLAPGAGFAVDQLTDEQIGLLVQSFEVQSERASGVRYLGTLTYRFHPDAVGMLLADAGISAIDMAGAPVLVIPILRTSTDALLWDDPNPWRQAWQANPPSSPLAPVVVPFGDIEDVADLSVEQALAADPAALAAIAARYNVDEVVLATIDAGGPAIDPGTSLTVSVSRIVPYGPVETAAVTVPPAATEEQQLREATRAVAQWLEQSWQLMAATGGAEARVRAVVQVSGLDDWISLRRTIEGLPQVAAVELVGLARDEVTVDIVHRGGPVRLRAALAQRGLELEGGALAGVSVVGAGTAPVSDTYVIRRSAGGGTVPTRP